MREIYARYKEVLINYWNKYNKRQRIMIIGTILLLLISTIIVIVYSTKPKFTVVFTNLDERDAAAITQRLDELKIPYQLLNGGMEISVPEQEAAKVKITLAAENLPNHGKIGYEFFQNNVSQWGMTDSQAALLERSAMEGELERLITQINGIQKANVMITLPKDSVFINDPQEKATASVIVEIKPGTILTQQQVNSLYQLIAKSVPNLPIENITIVNQYSEPLEAIVSSNNSSASFYDEQKRIQLEYQSNIQKEIQRYLEMLMGKDKVIVSVFVKMNFDQENVKESLFEPINKIDNTGIIRSVERIKESYSGTGTNPTGVVGTGNTTIPSYPTNSTNNSGNYDNSHETINYEMNQVTKEIIKNKYKIVDIAINVGIEPPDPNNPSSLTDQTKQDIKTVLTSFASAALTDSLETKTITNEAINSKINLIVQNFQGKYITSNSKTTSINPLLLYGGLGVGVIAVGGLILLIYRRRKEKVTTTEDTKVPQISIPKFDEDHILTEEALIRKELERFSKQKPEDFANLLRTWLNEE